MNPRLRIVVPAALVSLLSLTALPAAGSETNQVGSQLSKINHIVVVYQENHSFDNLYGRWERVNGLANASSDHTLQIKQDGSTYACLLQNDVNLTSPPLPADCADTTGTPAKSRLRQSLRQRALRDRDLHSVERQDVPAAGRLRATWPPPEPQQPARRLYPRYRAPLLPGAIPAQRWPAESLHDGQRRGRPNAGLLRHPRASHLPV